MSSNEPTTLFSDFIRDMADGTIDLELAKKLRETLETLEDWARDAQRKAKGKLSISLEIVMEPDGAVRLHPDIQIKIPKPLFRGDSFFTDGHGNLQRSNRRQPSLPFDPVTGEVKDTAPVAQIRDITQERKVKN